MLSSTHSLFYSMYYIYNDTAYNTIILQIKKTVGNLDELYDYAPQTMPN